MSFHRENADLHATLQHVPVLLRLRSYVPHWEVGPRHIRTWLEQHAQRRYPGVALSELPPIDILETELSREELRLLYGSSDAFVLPTKGEGWGLPVVEAMAMALPVIVTDYSGPAAYLTAENSYPLKYRPPHASSAGQVEPDTAHLRQLMRRVVTHREEGRSRGDTARLDMIKQYSPAVVLSEIEGRLRNIALGQPQVVSAGDWNAGVRKVGGSTQSDRQPYAGKLASSAAKKTAAAAANEKAAKAAKAAATAGEGAARSMSAVPQNVPPSHNGKLSGDREAGRSDGRNGLLVWLWVGANALLLVTMVGMAVERDRLKERRWKQS